MGFELDTSYKDVPSRIADFREKHPDGRLRPAYDGIPYRIETVGDQTFVVYIAAAYRTADDPMPGIGMAWEPFPGKTPYTRNSELQNAETSAWGRAIVAALASESKSIASAEDVHNRRAEQEVDEVDPGVQLRRDLRTRISKVSPEQRASLRAFCDEHKITRVTKDMTDEDVERVVDFLDALVVAAQQDAAEQPDADPHPEGDTPSAADEPEQQTLGDEGEASAEEENQPEVPAGTGDTNTEHTWLSPDLAVRNADPDDPMVMNHSDPEEVTQVIERVKELPVEAVDSSLRSHKVRVAGGEDLRRSRLVLAMLRERRAREHDAETGGQASG